MIFIGLAIGALVWVSYSAGWRMAHITIAAECERLGGFFVGDKTLHCTATQEKLDGGTENE